MALGDHIRAVPVLGLALAGGLAIGLGSAYVGGDPGSASVPPQAAPAVTPPPPPVKWVIRSQSAPKDDPVGPPETLLAHAAPIRRSAPAAGIYYSGCRAVRAAGAAPLYRGEPGYRPEMDGDGDGIACEPHR